MEIACIGAGPAGLYFAILMKLQDATHGVTIYEKSSAGAAHGVGVVFWYDLISSLRDNDPETASKVEAISFEWHDQVFARAGSSPIRKSGNGFSIRRQHLLDILTERARDLGVDFRYDHQVDPARLPHTDLVVVSDGAGSSIRQLKAAEFGTRVQMNRNKYVWLSTTKVFNSFSFGIARTDAGWFWCHAYGFDAEASTFIVECSPETWTAAGFENLDQKQGLQLLAKIFHELLEGHPIRTPIYQGPGLRWLTFPKVTNTAWHAGNVVLVGDAAHTTHFSIGSGTRLALEDAISLASNVRKDNTLKGALRAYTDQRRAAIAVPQRDAHLSAQWFDNMSRYVDLSDERLFELLLDRRSRLMARLPPLLYLQLKALAQKVRPRSAAMADF